MKHFGKSWSAIFVSSKDFFEFLGSAILPLIVGFYFKNNPYIIFTMSAIFRIIGISLLIAIIIVDFYGNVDLLNLQLKKEMPSKLTIGKGTQF